MGYLPWVVSFAIAMAFLESAVVVYLRALYYPEGFNFPLEPIAPRIALTEILREFATLVMLLAPGALLSRKRLDRFAWFCICFGIWDIFYYVFLWAILGWPITLWDMDILFLLPVPWVGPVLAPCLVSVGLITLGCLILGRRNDDPIKPVHWLALIVSGLLILYTFLEGPIRFMRTSKDHMGTEVGAGMDALTGYVPEHFAWGVFIAASLLGSAVFLDMVRRRS